MDIKQLNGNLQSAINALGAITLHGNVIEEQQNYVRILGVINVLANIIRDNESAAASANSGESADASDGGDA
jgi:hypothetical protein